MGQPASAVKALGQTAPAGLCVITVMLIPRKDDTTNYDSDGKPGLNENYGSLYAAQMQPFTPPPGIAHSLSVAAVGQHRRHRSARRQAVWQHDLPGFFGPRLA